MDAAAKTSEDTAKMSLHIKGTPTASQETNCIPNNQMLETRIGTYKATGKSCNPTPAQYKDRYPFLREVDSLALCNAQLNVEKAYRNFFRDPKHIGFPKYKAKHRNRQTYTTNNSNIPIRYKIQLLTLRPPVIIIFSHHQHIPCVQFIFPI